MRQFKTADAYRPTGDQPKATAQPPESIGSGERSQTLLGATGTGKTATMAWIIEQTQKPALVIAHNKTLAAQLCNECRECFPAHAGEPFVSLTVGEETDRDVMLRKLIDIQYVRNDTLLGRGRFRVKGDVIEIQPAYAETDSAARWSG